LRTLRTASSLPLLEHDAHVVAQVLEARDVAGEELRHRRGVAVHAQHGLPPARVVAHLGAHVVHAGDHLAGQQQQPLAGRGQVQPARMALEQLGLELVLQQRQPAARHGHGDQAGLCGTREIAQLGGPHEQRERVEIGQHRAIVRQPAGPACRAGNAPLPRIQFRAGGRLPTVAGLLEGDRYRDEDVHRRPLDGRARRALAARRGAGRRPAL
jgi:hypothetical protein